MSLKRLEIFHELLRDSVWERYKLLPQISALLATLLVVATFNEKLLPLTNYVRALLVILLVLIPISLIGYLWELERAEKHAYKNIQKIDDGQKTIGQKQNLVTAYLPKFVVIVISIVIFFVILSISNFIGI